MNSKRHTLLSVLLAFLGTCGLEIFFAVYESFTGGMIFLPVVYVLFRAYSASMNRKRTLGFDVLVAVLALIYAILFGFGMQMDAWSQASLEGWSFLAVLLLSIGIFPLLRLLVIWLEGFRIETRANPLVLKRCFLVLLVIWGLTYLALFPGVYGIDAPYWHYEFSHPDVSISSQWSPAYCGLWYSFVHFGEVFLNSAKLGFALFAAFQMVVTLYVVWRILKFTAARLNERFVIGATVFFMVPIHAILALTSAQDAMFVACFGMSVLYLLEYLLDGDRFWNAKANVVKLILWTVLMCVVRNNGLYALMVLAVVVLLVKQARRLLIPFAMVVVLVLVYQNPVYTMLGIEKGTAVREMLSLPLQQMGYVYNYSDRITYDLKAEMQNYVSDEGWQSYEPCISDHVKGQLNVDAVKSDMPAFLKLYVKCFLADPEGYLQAAGLQTFSLWYPSKSWPDSRPWHPYLDIICSETHGLYGDDFSIGRKSLCPPYRLILECLYGHGTPGDGYGGNLEMYFTRIPILNELSLAGTYTWILIFGLFYAIYKRNKAILVIWSFELGLWLTVLLSPVIMYRYCAPFIFTAPLYVSGLLLLKNRT